MQFKIARQRFLSRSVAGLNEAGLFIWYGYKNQMNRTTSSLVGYVMLGVGLAVCVVLLAVNWSRDARFHDECYLAAGEWAAYEVIPPKSPGSLREIKLEDFYVAVDKQGRPIDRKLAAFTNIRLPGTDSTFVLSKRIETNLSALDLDGNVVSFVVAIACSISLAMLGLALILLPCINDRACWPLVFGFAPLSGFSLAKFHFYLLYERPWGSFSKVYYSVEAGPKLSFPVFSVGLTIGVIVALVVWAYVLAERRDGSQSPTV